MDNSNESPVFRCVTRPALAKLIHNACGLLVARWDRELHSWLQSLADAGVITEDDFENGTFETYTTVKTGDTFLMPRAEIVDFLSGNLKLNLEEMKCRYPHKSFATYALPVMTRTVQVVVNGTMMEHKVSVFKELGLAGRN